MTGQELPGMARRAIRDFLECGTVRDFSGEDPWLNQPRGLFVTLRKQGRLRGCIGLIEPTMPLGRAIGRYGCAAAFEDTRFNPVTAEELADMEIEISLLSSLQRVDDPASIEMGTHGVVVRRGGRSGVFLPQVADETGWSRDEFLDNLCAQKAGLPAAAWKDEETELYSFTVEVFEEKQD